MGHFYPFVGIGCDRISLLFRVCFVHWSVNYEKEKRKKERNSNIESYLWQERFQICLRRDPGCSSRWGSFLFIFFEGGWCRGRWGTFSFLPYIYFIGKWKIPEGGMYTHESPHPAPPAPSVPAPVRPKNTY
jgi:hypothetical protein